MDNRIKVGVRVRPLSIKEQQEASGPTTGAAVTTERDGSISVLSGSGESKNKFTFKYDWAFGPNSAQDAIYGDMCKPLIDRVFDGYNATFFACKFGIVSTKNICFANMLTL
jgi:hypothetical protein